MVAFAKIFNGSRPIGARHPDTGKLVEQALKMQPGEVASYASLEAILGRHLENKGADNKIQSATRILRRQHSINMSPVFGKGWKRETAEDSVDLLDHDRKAVRGKIRRAAERSTNIDLDTLEEKKRILALTAQAMYGFLDYAFGNRALKKVAEAQSVKKKMLGPEDVGDILQ